MNVRTIGTNTCETNRSENLKRRNKSPQENINNREIKKLDLDLAVERKIVSYLGIDDKTNALSVGLKSLENEIKIIKVYKELLDKFESNNLYDQYIILQSVVNVGGNSINIAKQAFNKEKNYKDIKTINQLTDLMIKAKEYDFLKDMVLRDDYPSEIKFILKIRLKSAFPLKFKNDQDLQKALEKNNNEDDDTKISIEICKLIKETKNCGNDFELKQHIKNWMYNYENCQFTEKNIDNLISLFKIAQINDHVSKELIEKTKSYIQENTNPAFISYKQKLLVPLYYFNEKEFVDQALNNVDIRVKMAITEQKLNQPITSKTKSNIYHLFTERELSIMIDQANLNGFELIEKLIKKMIETQDINLLKFINQICENLLAIEKYPELYYFINFLEHQKINISEIKSKIENSISCINDSTTLIYFNQKPIEDSIKPYIRTLDESNMAIYIRRLITEKKYKIAFESLSQYSISVINNEWAIKLFYLLSYSIGNEGKIKKEDLEIVQNSIEKMIEIICINKRYSFTTFLVMKLAIRFDLLEKLEEILNIMRTKFKNKWHSDGAFIIRDISHVIQCLNLCEKFELTAPDNWETQLNLNSGWQSVY